MKGMVGIENSLSEIIAVLNESGHNEVAIDLSVKQRDMRIESKQLQSLKEIEGLCHIKALGDLHVSGFEGYDWANRIGKVGSKCRRIIEQIEENT